MTSVLFVCQQTLQYSVVFVCSWESFTTITPSPAQRIRADTDSAKSEFQPIRSAKQVPSRPSRSSDRILPPKPTRPKRERDYAAFPVRPSRANERSRSPAPAVRTSLSHRSADSPPTRPARTADAGQNTADEYFAATGGTSVYELSPLGRDVSLQSPHARQPFSTSHQDIYAGDRRERKSQLTDSLSPSKQYQPLRLV